MHLRHSALEPLAGPALGDARLTDRDRLALLFQGLALVGHLRGAGWRLEGGFRGARVATGARLGGLAARPGRSHQLVQQEMGALWLPLYGGEERIPGRGEWRVVARETAERWRQALRPVDVDLELGRLLERASFLATEAGREARRALAAEVAVDGRVEILLLGPPQLRRSLLAGVESFEALTQRLAGPWFESAWQEARAKGPSQQAETSADDRLAEAQREYDRGRFEAALRRLERSSTAAGELLRLRCLRQLARFAAIAESLRGLGAMKLTPEQLAEAAELATLAAENLGEREIAQPWLARVRRELTGRWTPLAALVAAGTAWDRADAGAMSAEIEAAAPLAEHGEFGWRWSLAAGECALLAGDAAQALARLAAPLARRRRRALRPFEAGRLWVAIGSARATLGDLAASERAYLHAARLLGRCDGPAQVTLGLVNLAETRLRRGRLIGVEQILEAVEAENRRQRNRRSEVYDQELWARFELVRGHPEAALARCREALARQAREGREWRASELHLMAARALGWLGHPAEAKAEMARVRPESLAELEPEERPAVWALAGAAEEAWREAAAGDWAALWRALLDGESPAPALWTALHALEPYRAARLVLDAEQLVPAAAPPAWQRAARATFERLGAHRFADRVGGDESTAWRAVERWALAEPGDREALSALFADAGEPAARLLFRDEREQCLLVAGEGGDEHLTAPLGHGGLELSAPRATARLRALFALVARRLEPPRRRARPAGDGEIIGESPAFLAVLERLRLLASRELPLLVTGESGTGKELAARAVHRHSRRRAGPFVPVNCAGLSETLIHSDLFGHARGAFTGADRDRTGVFEAARDGTLFLDEIGDLPLGAQGNLLRVLQEGEIRRLGESLPRKVNVRVVAATHRDLAAMVRAGQFREDLYYRLRAAQVRLPPLRERGRDLLLIAEHLLAGLASEGGRPPVLSRSARERLLAHRWPGNVRELANALDSAVAMAGSGPIEAHHLELEDQPAGTARGDYQRQVAELRRELVEETLASCGGNQAAAARQLGISRQSLGYLVHKLGIVNRRGGR